MHPVFQEIVEIATAKLREALSQETGEGELGEWDPDGWEQAVREFTRQVGQRALQGWAAVKSQQALAQARICSCGQRRQVHQST